MTIGNRHNLVQVHYELNAYADQHGVTHPGYVVEAQTIVEVIKEDVYNNGYDQNTPLLYAIDKDGVGPYSCRTNTIDFYGGFSKHWRGPGLPGKKWEEYRESSSSKRTPYVNPDGSPFVFDSVWRAGCWRTEALQGRQLLMASMGQRDALLTGLTQLAEDYYPCVSVVRLRKLIAEHSPASEQRNNDG